MVRIRGVSDPTLWLQAKVTKNARLLIGRCRNVDFPWDERCPIFLSVLEELCASSQVEWWHLWVRRWFSSYPWKKGK